MRARRERLERWAHGGEWLKRWARGPGTAATVAARGGNGVIGVGAQGGNGTIQGGTDGQNGGPKSCWVETRRRRKRGDPEDEKAWRTRRHGGQGVGASWRDKRQIDGITNRDAEQNYVAGKSGR
jgi:hypothetical protein